MSQESVFNDPLAFDSGAGDLFSSAAPSPPPTGGSSMREPLDLTPEVLQLQCPRCRVPLRKGLLYDHWQVCGCADCGGFVVPKRSFQEMIRRLRAAYRGPDDRPTPMDPAELNESCDCPGCLQPMETHPYYGPGNSVIDSCAGCGVTWLDQSELERIIRAPGQRGDGYQPAPVRPAFDVPPDPLTAALENVFSRRSRFGFRWS